MTTGDKLHQTLSSLRGAKADMEAFAMETDNQKAQKLYNQGAQQLEQLVNQVSQRTNNVEKEEPQYKVRQNQNQNQQNNNR
ncbi:MAG: DUF1657 domain-containing protein [Halanaerobiaceae bacterium]